MERESILRQRRERIARRCKKESIDALLVTGMQNVAYLTGFGGDSSYLIVGPSQTLFVTDRRFEIEIQTDCPGLEAYVRAPTEPLADAVAQCLTRLKLKTVGLEANSMTVGQWATLQEKAENISWKSTNGWVEELRAIKDADEIATLRHAVHVAQHAFAQFRASLLPTDSEKGMTDAMEQCVRRFGGECTAFPPIVALGPRAALPHARPGADQCVQHEILLVDWGARCAGYHSDLTRTLHFGKPSKQFVKIYSTVLAAQAAAIAAIRPGAELADIDHAARKVIEAAGFGPQFNHSIGHGIGLQIHENPFMRSNAKGELAAGMVVTVEPGIYIEGWGGVRIEDDVLVTRNGREVLSTTPKELDQVLLDR